MGLRKAPAPVASAQDALIAAIVAAIAPAIAQAVAGIAPEAIAPAPEAVAPVNTFVTDVIAGGKSHACEIAPSCGKSFRTVKRAADHWHAATKA